MPLAIANTFLVLVLALLAVDARAAKPPSPDKPAATYRFSFDTLLADAKRRAAAAYSPQRSSLPAILDKLSPEQYRSIQFNPDAGIWRAEELPFRLELLRAHHNLQTTVTVSTVEDGMATDIVPDTRHVRDDARSAGAVGQSVLSAVGVPSSQPHQLEENLG